MKKKPLQNANAFDASAFTADSIERREFMKLLAASTSLLAAPLSLFGLTGCTSEQSTISASAPSLYALFSDPPSQAKPFYRWWWNGNRVTNEGVKRDLELMKSIGAGGVEINPIAMNVDTEKLSGEPLEWLGDDYNKVLKTALYKAKDLGMIADMIIGTGWPFGGKFIKDEETLQGYQLYRETVSGPKRQTMDLKEIKKPKGKHTDLNGKTLITHAILTPIPFTGLSDVIDVTEQLLGGEVTVPAGDFTLSVAVWRNKFRAVHFGSPGGDGQVLDHFNKTAVEKYLARTSDRLTPLLDNDVSTYVRSMFCDSIELKGSNWTHDLRAQFEGQHGYDLWPYLPMVLEAGGLESGLETSNEFGDILLRVRYDYSATLAKIFMERFILTFHNWCQALGVKSRYQAYGTPTIPTDLLAGYMVPDIPEGDQWVHKHKWTATEINQLRYAIWNKFAASASHLRGLKIASAEAMTSTEGIFDTSLEYIKQASDLNFIAGINHMVMHGWNYSPQGEPYPGWIRYGTWFNERNPWFPYLKTWSDYTARLCAVFQESQAVCQVAIMGPTADRWSDAGLNREAMLTDPWYLHSTWQSVNHHGYCADHLNPEVFGNATYEGGKINYGPMQYDVLILCDMESAQPDFIDSLTAYAARGGKILFIGQTPSKGPGMKFKDDTRVKEKTDALLGAYGKTVKVIAAPRQGSDKKSVRAAVKAYSDLLGKTLAENNIKPGVKISNPDELLYHFQAQHNANPLFFFSNQSRSAAINFTAEFDVKGLYPWKWDAENGQKSLFAKSGRKVEIVLKPLESLLLVFSQDDQFEEEAKLLHSVTAPKDLNSDWQAEFIPMQEKPFTKSLKTLGDVALMPGLKGFSGTIIYRKSFNSGAYNKLDLGRVCETAEVTLNGHDLGLKYWGDRVFDIADAIKDGNNDIEIKVTTLAWNYASSLTVEQNRLAKKITMKNKNQKPRPSGLMGPVVIR